MSKALFIPLQLSLGTVLCFSASPLLAQVTSDGTVDTQVNQNGNVSEITGGATRGSNLFHSFQEFSVGTGNEAFFNNAESIQNIFSRVTGGNISNIDGLIRANGSASLFLINPAGIIFGSNARLDVGGSFYGSTASSILFEDGEFSAVDNLQQPVLTINAPIGLGFRDNPGDIVNLSVANDGQGLAVNPGNAISLLGGDVRFDGGRVTVPRGIVNLGGLSTAGTINIAQNGNLVFPNDVAKADIVFNDRAIVDLTSNGGGRITVNTNNLELTGESLFLASIGEDLGDTNAVAGTVEIHAQTLNFENDSAVVVSSFGQGNAGTVNINSQNLSFDGEWSGIYATLGLSRIATDDPINNAVGNGGEININTDSLTLTNGARIATNSVAQGNAGNINIEATGLVALSGFGTTTVPAFGGTVLTGINSQVQFEGEGNGGQVNLETGSLELSNGGGILADNDGVAGDGGDIQINVRESFLTSPGFVLIQTSANNTQGNSGNINITANSYESNGLQILADNLGQGDGGDIKVDVEETFSLNQDSLFQAGVKEGGIGNAGDIIINANSFVANDSGIAAKTEGQGNAGTISIATNEAISLNNQSLISSEVSNSATGNGGDINITGGELNLTNRSLIIANFAGQSINPNNISNGGNINIDIAGDITLDNDPENIISNNGNQIQSQVEEGAIGNAGNIRINVGGSLISNNGNQILTGSSGNGNSGNIQITAQESIELNDNSLVFANIGEQGSGDAGNIAINATNVFSLDESLVLSEIENEAEGNAGNINITSNIINVGNFGTISTNARGESSFGNAGNINLNGATITINTGANISALTENNFPGGDITLEGGNLELLSGGAIVTSTDSAGNAGNITLNLTGNIEINGKDSIPRPESVFELQETILNDLQESTGLFATSVSEATGNGGNIKITNSGTFTINNNGSVSVDSQGEGNSGVLTIDSNSLKLNSGIISAATESGSGGNITLIIDETISLDNNSLISAEAFGNANGGNLTIDSRFIIAFPDGNNDIIANAERGTGGNINITAESLFGIRKRVENDFTNDIDASSRFSLNGNVRINTPDVNPVQGATELPQNPIEPGQTTEQACRANREALAQGGLTIKGKGGIPPGPELPLDSHNISVKGETDDHTVEIPAPIETAKGKIQPAMGVIVTESGKVILTPYSTANVGSRIPEPRRCG